MKHFKAKVLDYLQRMSSGTKTNRIKAQVLNFLQRMGWRYHDLDEKAVFTGLKRKDYSWFFFFICNEERQEMVLIGSQRTVIPEQYRFQVAELLTRANAVLTIGNFILDFENGNYRFQIGLNLEGGTLSNEMLRNSLNIALIRLDGMQPYILRLLSGETDVPGLYKEWFDQQ